MKLRKIKDQEGALLNLLDDIAPLAWRKYQQRNPEVWVKDHFEREDRSVYPPYISFRFECEDKSTLEKIDHSIRNYKGKIKWEISGRQREGLPGCNWCIEPSRVYEIEEIARNLNLAPSQYMAIHEPEFGPVAYEDLIGLTEHVRNAFKDILGNVDAPENP